MNPRFPGHGSGPERDHAVYVISVAAELTGLHPQTLRTYERLGLITPGRTGGGGRRYSAHDIDLLRHIAALTATGIGIEGVRRIMDLENQVDALRTRVRELSSELESVRQAAVAINSVSGPAPGSRLPVLRSPEANQSVVVWRRNPS